MSQNNLIGQKFNHLTILDYEYKIDKKNKKRKYCKCQCDCGNIKLIRSDEIQNGHTKSCGCYKTNLLIQNNKKRIKDISNQKFGKLTALYIDDTYQGEHTKWICKCECGNIISVFLDNLIRLHTTSCGCINYSIGEANIEKLLKTNNINYIKEYSFQDLKNIYKLRFDFAIFDDNNNLIELIEFDGRQHNNDYTPWDSQETLAERQLRDNLKNNYCKEHNIKLIRINYEKRDNITLKDLELI